MNLNSETKFIACHIFIALIAGFLPISFLNDVDGIASNSHGQSHADDWRTAVFMVDDVNRRSMSLTQGHELAILSRSRGAHASVDDGYDLMRGIVVNDRRRLDWQTSDQASRQGQHVGGLVRRTPTKVGIGGAPSNDGDHPTEQRVKASSEFRSEVISPETDAVRTPISGFDSIQAVSLRANEATHEIGPTIPSIKRVTCTINATVCTSTIVTNENPRKFGPAAAEMRHVSSGAALMSAVVNEGEAAVMQIVEEFRLARRSPHAVRGVKAFLSAFQVA